MPITARNGAILSDDQNWYYAIAGWKPVTPEPVSRKPSMAQTAKVATKASIATASAGKQLAQLVAQHGSLPLAEYMLGTQEQQAEQLGLTEMVKTYDNQEQVEQDLPRMSSAGWSAQGMGQGQQQTSAGRTAAGVAVGGLLTGGLGAVAGGIIGAAAKRQGRIEVTWTRESPR